MGDILKQATEAASNVSSTGNVVSNAPIWIGSTAGKLAPGNTGTAPTSKQTVSSSDLVNTFARWRADGDPRYVSVRNNLISAGLLWGVGATPNNWNSVQTAFSSAIAMYQQSSQKTDFGKWLDTSAKTNKVTGTGGAYSGPVTTTSVDVTDPDTAAAMLNKLSTDMLGRNLTHNEISKYTVQMNKAERANPQVTVSDGTGASRSSNTTTAPDKGEILRKILAKDSGFAENQIDTNIMDMFVNQIKKGQDILNG